MINKSHNMVVTSPLLTKPSMKNPGSTVDKQERLIRGCRSIVNNSYDNLADKIVFPPQYIDTKRESFARMLNTPPAQLKAFQALIDRVLYDFTSNCTHINIYRMIWIGFKLQMTYTGSDSAAYLAGDWEDEADFVEICSKIIELENR